MWKILRPITLFRMWHYNRMPFCAYYLGCGQKATDMGYNRLYTDIVPVCAKHKEA